MSAETTAPRTFVYVANAERGHVLAFRLKSDGALAPIRDVPVGPALMPLAVSPDRRFLYAHVRSQSRNVHSFAIDPQSGDLAERGAAPLPESASYISTDRTGRFLLSVSYGAGTLAVNPIEGGIVQGPPVQVSKVGPMPHAVLADPSNRFAYVPVLGADVLLQYRFDAATGALTPNAPAALQFPAGTNPRHFRFAPDGKNLYVLSESQGAVLRLAFDAATGLLALVDIVAGVPASFGLKPGKPRAPIDPSGKPVPTGDLSKDIWAADLHVTPDGRFVYASERTTGTLAAFAVAPDGTLTYTATFAGEAQPRGFGIDPSGQYLVCTGEKSSELSVHRIDRATGALTKVHSVAVGPSCNWVEFVAVD